MRAIGLAVFALSLTVAGVAEGQRLERVGVAPHPAVSAHAASARVGLASVESKAAMLPGNTGMPRWLRWGIVGAIGGAAVFALVDGLNNNGRHSIGSDILAGAATGFVVVGGGVLVYDSLCPPGSGRHSGFCGG